MYAQGDTEVLCEIRKKQWKSLKSPLRIKKKNKPQQSHVMEYTRSVNMRVVSH